MRRGHSLKEVREMQPAGLPVDDRWLVLVADPDSGDAYAFTIEELRGFLKEDRT